MHPPFSPRGENGPCTVQKTRQEGDFGLGPPLRRYDSRPLLGPPIVPLPRKSARFIRRRRRFADFPPPNHPFKRHKEGAAAPSLETPPHGAAAGREAERFDKHPGMRCHGTACGISVGGEARYSAPGGNWASLRKAGYQPFASPNLPGRASLDEKRFSFGPCTARFLWQDQRKWGVQTPRRKSAAHAL